jgi:DNA-binding response OmpR family regulator
VRVGETAVPLSRTQLDVLAVLLERRGEVVSHAGLARAAWGVQQVGSSRNFIEAAISRLRRAMQSAGATAVIETVAGHGYMIR